MNQAIKNIFHGRRHSQIHKVTKAKLVCAGKGNGTTHASPEQAKIEECSRKDKNIHRIVATRNIV